MKWNDKVYSQLIEEHPDLEAKPESVAIAVAALKANPEITPDEMRALSKQTGVRIAGRALGSARQLLGLGAGTKKSTKKKGKKRGRPAGSGRGPGRPPGSGRGPGRPRKTDNVGGSFDDLLSTMRQVQNDQQRMRKALEQIQDAAARALNG